MGEMLLMMEWMGMSIYAHYKVDSEQHEPDMDQPWCIHRLSNVHP